MSTKKEIEFNDVHEQLSLIKEEIVELCKRYVKDNQELPEDIDVLNDSGAVDQIIDGSVPIYTWDIRCNWLFYHDEFEGAYENAGIGDNPLENDGMTAIYFYLWEQVRDWFDSEDGKKDVAFGSLSEQAFMSSSVQ